MARTCYVCSILPVEKAEIVVLVLSEHDASGGGLIAAPIAQKILKKYWELKSQELKNISQKYLNHIIKNKQHDEQKTSHQILYSFYLFILMSLGPNLTVQLKQVITLKLR